MNEATAISNTLATFAATYLFHSTVLLSACWLILKLVRARSYFLVERVWKVAAVMGLFTTLLQMTCGGNWGMQLTRLPQPHVAVIAASGQQAGASDMAPAREFLVDNSPVVPLGELPPAQPVLPDISIEETAADTVAAWELPAEPQSPDVRFTPRESAVRYEVVLPADWAAVGAEAERGVPPLVIPSRGVDASAVSRAESLGGWRWMAPWMSWLLSLILLGSLLLGGALFALHSWRLRMRFATSRPLTRGRARDALDRFLKRNRIRRRVRLLVSADHHEPVTYGLWVWTIVLPQRTEDRLGNEELKALIAHEVAHLVRGDVWWLWIGRLICTCLAFQPLNLVARRQWQQAAEYLCDDWAVARGVRSLALARCLTQIAEWRFGREPCHVGLAAGGTKVTLIQRVERLVATDRSADAWSQPVRRRLLMAGALIVALGMIGLTPPLTLPSATAARLEKLRQAAPIGHEDAAALETDWHLLQEELLQLDADLAHLNQVHSTTSLRGDLQPHINDLNRQAAALRVRRTQITTLFEKDSRR